MKKNKDDLNNDRQKASVSKEVREVSKSFIDKILGDVSKTSATKQIAIGASSGWVTGFLAMKVGKVAAFSVGGGIILLQIAANHGYIKINWDKIQNKAEKLSDNLEEKITGEGPKLIDKVERYVDKKLDKAESFVHAKKMQGQNWYNRLLGDESVFKPRETHFFIVSFIAGTLIGVATSP